MGEKVKITYMIQDYQKARIKVFRFFREVVTKKIEVNFLMKKYFYQVVEKKPSLSCHLAGLSQ